MTRLSSERKYQPIWDQIKKAEAGELEVSIPEFQAYSQNQLARIQKTIRKAVINEKCIDYGFKRNFPRGELKITFLRIEEAGDPNCGKFAGKIKFKLIRDVLDCTKLF